MARHVRKGDKVAIMAGKYRGHQGVIVEVLTSKNRVRVEGITVKRHLKPGREQQFADGGIIEKLGSVHISNVLPLDPKTGKPTRVGFKRLEDGRKVRVAKGSGEVLAS